MQKLNPDKLDELRAKLKSETRDKIRVGMSTCGIAAGAEEVFNLITDEVKKRNLNIEVSKCGCFGMCYAEPLVEVSVKNMPKVIYGNVDKDTAIKIVDKHVLGERMVNDHVVEILDSTEDR
jgi:(2Fe-2S) ferredoxin